MKKQNRQVLIMTGNAGLEQAAGLYPSLFSYRPTHAARILPGQVKLVPMLTNVGERLLSTQEEIESGLARFDKILCDPGIPVRFPFLKQKCVEIGNGELYEKRPGGGRYFVTLLNDDEGCPSIGGFVCRALQEVKSMGYQARVESDSPQLAPYLSLFTEQPGEPDVRIFITESYDIYAARAYDLGHMDPKGQQEQFTAYLLSLCRGGAAIGRFLERNGAWLRRRILKYVRLLKVNRDGSCLLYKTVNRSVIEAEPEAARLYLRLLSGNAAADEDFEREPEENRWRWEWLYKICFYEYQKENEYERQLSSPFLKICNRTDVIVSWLGSRRCNMDCKYCFSDHKKQNHARVSDTDKIQTLEFCRNLSSAEYVHIDNYLGGEPCAEFKTVQQLYSLMRDYQEAHKLDFSFGLLTNGTIMDEKQLEWARENTPYIGLSLDGDQETNDRIRVYPDGGGTYRDAVRFIRRVEEKNWPVPIGVSCVLTANNLDLVQIFRHIYEQLGVRYITIKPVRAGADSDFALTGKDMPALKEAYRAFIKYLLERLKDGDMGPLSAVLHPIDYLGRFLARTGLEDRVIVKRCGAGEHIFSIDNDNRVYACDSFNGVEEACIGTWETGRTGKFCVPFVTKTPDMGCADCWARYSCGGVCSYVRHLNHGKITEVVRFECEFTQFLVYESLMFWEEVKRTLPASEVEQIFRHMEKMGFLKYKKDRDHFFYAPC